MWKGVVTAVGKEGKREKMISVCKGSRERGVMREKEGRRE